MSSFAETQYTTDLGDCRGGTFFEVALSGLGGAVVGSAIGAFEGAIHGAWSGNSPEGAAIGAVIGRFGLTIVPLTETMRALQIGDNVGTLHMDKAIEKIIVPLLPQRAMNFLLIRHS